VALAQRIMATSHQPALAAGVISWRLAGLSAENSRRTISWQPAGGEIISSANGSLWLAILQLYSS